MRVVLILVVTLVLLNLFAYFYREQALDIYQSVAQRIGMGEEAIPGIVLLSEQKNDQSEISTNRSDTGDAVTSVNEASIDNTPETGHSQVCWKFESSGDSMETLYERLDALDIPAELQLAEQGTEELSSLTVEETGHWQLSPGFEERLKIDWPDVTWSRVDCAAIALGGNLH